MITDPIYKLSRLSREEVQAMLQVHDIRETRVYQEAKEEGVQEERQRIVSKMAACNMPPERIAEILGMDEDSVRKQLAKDSRNVSPR